MRGLPAFLPGQIRQIQLRYTCINLIQTGVPDVDLWICGSLSGPRYRPCMGHICMGHTLNLTQGLFQYWAYRACSDLSACFLASGWRAPTSPKATPAWGCPDRTWLVPWQWKVQVTGCSGDPPFWQGSFWGQILIYWLRASFHLDWKK